VHLYFISHIATFAQEISQTFTSNSLPLAPKVDILPRDSGKPLNEKLVWWPIVNAKRRAFAASHSPTIFASALPWKDRERCAGSETRQVPNWWPDRNQYRTAKVLMKWPLRGALMNSFITFITQPVAWLGVAWRDAANFSRWKCRFKVPSEMIIGC